MSESTQANEDDELSSLDFPALWSLISSAAVVPTVAHATHGYFARKIDWARDLTTTNSTQATQFPEFVQLATSFLENMRQLNDLQLAPGAKAQAKAQCMEKGRLLDAQFLSKKVGAVYTTCTSSSSALPVDHFKPNLIVVEKAEQVSVGELCVAFKAHKETVSMVHMSGDPNHWRNECASLSFLKMVIDQPENRAEVIHFN